MTSFLDPRRPHRARWPLSALACACLAAWTPAPAQTAHATPASGLASPDSPSPAGAVSVEPDASVVPAIKVTARHYDNAVGASDAASQGVIRAELLKSRPGLRPGEVLEFVPGMIVTQHSGDGKANQYFLRGFNLDHGTDFATTVNGLPVNMPTHGHSQGYADLNFLIPELVDRIEYRKGPYFAQAGDFSAAGSADIRYVRKLDGPQATLTIGQRGYRRALGAGSTEVQPGLSLLGAVELQRNDGPWTVPEGQHKANGVLTLSGGSAARGFSASVMHYDAHWTATNQVPQRLIDAGSYLGRPFGRFDSLDPSDGGNTRRSSLSGEWHARGDDGSATQVAAYALDYRLQLFSNHTFALERPDQGDQIAQRDRRQVYGLSASHAVNHALGALPARSEVGWQLRHDRIRVGLFDSAQRQLTATVREDRVRQTQWGLYGQTSVEVTPWLRTIAGLRADQARFDVDNVSGTANSGAASAHLWSPKLSLVLGPWQRTEFFFNAGRGFHSNDARGATDAAAPVPGLVAARGMELGARSELMPGLQSSLALWKLDFDSELVYVGDAGGTEPNRPSRRHGVEWNNRYIPLPWLLVDADLAWSQARFATHAPEGDQVPNAVNRIASVALTLRELGPWSASLQWRYLGSAALVEDDSVRSRPSLTTNLRLARRLGRDSEITLDVFNLFNRKVNDIEYAYESHAPGEALPVTDARHVHPAEPRTLRLTLKVGF
ncbi:TonB-dependent receptor [Azohydromonas lata]|uniref:TonB-dependent receptor n=1 Tax=Azohydromonas lata TaxID=45677 RepID=A0ABU5IJ42_9BURK|nr:TonB-dependent receptor [Azohydromonas lata]MDZ5458523.1 TonB-dependent receptor [Azohydromonas lata]